MSFKKLTGVSLISVATFVAASGCSDDDADLGSNGAGSGGTGAAAGSPATGGSGGSVTAGRGGDAPGGGGASEVGGAGGRGATGGSAGASRGGRGGSNGGAGAAAGAGAGGVPGCPCEDESAPDGCCIAISDCDPAGVPCEELRASIVELRAWERIDGNEVEGDCVERLSAAIVDRCAFEPPVCPDPQEDYATFGDHGEYGYSECSQAETQDALRCGAPGSLYGPECCQRTRCADDDDCAGGTCVPRVVQSWRESPGYPHAESCALVPEGCGCGWIEAWEGHRAYCIAEDEDLARFDCDVESPSCAELGEWDAFLLAAIGDETLFDAEGTPSPESLILAYWTCEEKVSKEIASRCEAPADCRTDGCERNDICIECLDPESETYFLCVHPSRSCPPLTGAGGAGGSGGEGP